MPKTIIKYTMAISLAILLLLVLHLNYGTAVTSVPVAVVFYGWLVFVTVRWLVRSLFKKKRDGIG